MNKFFLNSALLVGLTSLIGGCAALRPATYDCSNLVSAPEIGSRITLPTETGQEVIARLNGVNAICTDKKDRIDIDLEIGLKLKRNLEEGADPLLLEVPFIAAQIDEEEAVKGHESFSYRMAFSDKVDIFYPLVKHDTSLSKNGRLVISMVPYPIDID